MPRTLLIGGGNMGGAMVAGLVAAGTDPGTLAVIEPHGARREELAAAHRGLVVAGGVDDDFVETHGVPEGTVLAVKPEVTPTACAAAARAGARRVLSVITGVSCARLEAMLPADTAVVRAVPNTPALVGAGVSVMAGGGHVSAADLDWAEAMLGALGTVVRLAERHLDAVTGLSGSGPAYYFVVVEALVEGGVVAGLPRQVAERLAVETLTGAGALLAARRGDPATLRSMVTSPGGTTAAGLRALEARAVRSAFIEAVAQATERARQLGHSQP